MTRRPQPPTILRMGRLIHQMQSSFCIRNFSLPGPRVYPFTNPVAFPCCQHLLEMATQFPGIATWKLSTWFRGEGRVIQQIQRGNIAVDSSSLELENKIRDWAIKMRVQTWLVITTKLGNLKIRRNVEWKLNQDLRV